MQKFRIVGTVSGKNKSYINCDICLDNKKHMNNARGRPMKTSIILAPIDNEGNDIEVNNISRFFMCETHCNALRRMGAIPSIVEQLGLMK